MRTNYSAFGSPDGRLTNVQGMELGAGYVLSNKARPFIKYYLVEQLVAWDITQETGSQIPLDLDVDC